MYPTKQEVDFAVNLVNELVGLGMFECMESHGECGLCNWMFENNLHRLGYSWGSGVTKACISHTDLANWVIKVRFKDTKRDYCSIEYNNYLSAVEEKLEGYFPFTDFLCEKEGFSFFIQERAECNEDTEEEVSSCWYESAREELIWDGEDPQGEWFMDRVCDLVDDYDDLEKANIIFGNDKLTRFLQRNRITDLHQGNFGIIDGNIVIIDFSGYVG